jgi:hypothetical protein
MNDINRRSLLVCLGGIAAGGLMLAPGIAIQRNECDLLLIDGCAFLSCGPRLYSRSLGGSEAVYRVISRIKIQDDSVR